MLEEVNDCLMAEMNGDEQAFEDARNILYDVLIDQMLNSGSIAMLYGNAVLKIRRTITSKDERCKERLKMSITMMKEFLDQGEREKAAEEWKKQSALMKWVMRPESMVEMFSDGTGVSVPFTKDELDIIKGEG